MDLALGGSTRTNAQQVQLVTQLANTRQGFACRCNAVAGPQGFGLRQTSATVCTSSRYAHACPAMLSCEADNPVCYVLLAGCLVPAGMRTCLLTVKVTAVDWQAQKGQWRAPKARAQLCM